MKKINYFLAVFIVSSLLFVCYLLFFATEKSVATDQTQTTLVLQPFTLKEQKELADAEERDESAKPTGPLIAFTTAIDAQAKVLNLNRK